MNKQRCSTLILICLAVFRLNAQQSDPVPAPPFVGALPERFAYVVTYKRAKPTPPNEKPARTRKELSVVKTGLYQQEILTWSDGTKDTVYFVQGCELLENPTTKAVDVIPGGMGPHDFFGSGLSDAAWVGKESFLGTVKLAGQSCHHYSGAGYVTPDQRLLNRKVHEGAAAGGASEAWIDAESRFPVLVKTLDEIIEYHYLASPKEDLVLPEKFVASWNKYQHGLRLMNVMRMR